MADRYHYVYEMEDDLRVLNSNIKDIEEDNQNIVSHSLVADAQTTINNIEERVKETKRYKRKIDCIKGVKIFGKMLHAIYPYVLVTGILLGITTTTDDLPFRAKEELKYARYEMTIDSNGEKEDNKNYEKNVTSSEGRVDVVGKWELKEDGRYYRRSEVYHFYRRDLNKFLELRDKDNITMEDVFGSRGSPVIEVKDSLSDEELNQGPYIKMSYSYSDENDYLMLPNEERTKGNNMAFIGFELFLCIAIFFWRRGLFDQDFFFDVRSVKYDYKTPDMKDIMRQFKEKKKLFETIKNGEFTPIVEVERNIQNTKAMR